MIKHLRHHEIDKERWDESIKKAFNGIIYAYSWYLDIVSPGWEALITEDYKKVMPLTGERHYFFVVLSDERFPARTYNIEVPRIRINNSVERFLDGFIPTFLINFMMTQMLNHDFIGIAFSIIAS